MKRKSGFNSLIPIYSGIIIIFTVLLISCSNDDSNPTTSSSSVPVLTNTDSVSAITETTANCGGTITSDGGAPVTARGVCWSTSQTPTVSDSITNDGAGIGSFTSEMSGLTPDTTYYVRAYATNSAGTGYGSIMSFTTLPSFSLPELTTAGVSAITDMTANCGGTITSDGGAPVTARGVCWSTSQKPTVADNKTNDGTGAGSFTSEMSGLIPETDYYVRAYATNSAGTRYGNMMSFTTLPASSVPELTTAGVSAITDTSANCGGNVTSDGGATIGTRGVCWSTSQKPTVSDNKTIQRGEIGSFTSKITGLTPETTYYVRAYATNSAGTGYGAAVSLTTLETLTGRVTDIDGNIYRTIKIGSQWWMAENLKVTKYSNGRGIPNVTDNSEWANYSTGAYCNYNNDSRNAHTYGCLYNWYSANNIQNIAPEGWHVPTDEEWKQLEMYLGMSQSDADATGWRGTDEGSKLKATSGWNSSGNGTNESGFSALPGGFRYSSNGTFLHVGKSGYWWSSTEYSSIIAWYRRLNYGYSDVYRITTSKQNGYSIRCVKD